MSVLFVGCGNIGSRLLQSLVQVSPDHVGSLDIAVCEPFEGARALARARFNEVVGERSHLLRFVDDPTAVAGVALVVVPTDARNRLEALRHAMKAGPKRVLLEKFLFTRAEDYAVASNMLGEIPVYVNTSRNEWDGYKALKAELDGRKVMRLTAVGFDWNLASNGVHFLALMEFLSDAPLSNIEVDAVSQVRDAKRGGYKEFNGVLRACTAAGGKVTLESKPGDISAITVTLEGEGWSAEIREAAGEMVFKEGDGEGEKRKFKMNFASQLDNMFQQLLTDGAVMLPTFEESARLHLLAMEAMNEAFYGVRTLDKECPVT